jgi:hypothetical protein
LRSREENLLGLIQVVNPSINYENRVVGWEVWSYDILAREKCGNKE